MAREAFWCADYGWNVPSLSACLGNAELHMRIEDMFEVPRHYELYTIGSGCRDMQCVPRLGCRYCPSFDQELGQSFCHGFGHSNS